MMQGFIQWSTFFYTSERDIKVLDFYIFDMDLVINGYDIRPTVSSDDPYSRYEISLIWNLFFGFCHCQSQFDSTQYTGVSATVELIQLSLEQDFSSKSG